MTAGAPRVYTIPAGTPFLKTLADALFDGHLVPGFPVDGDPLAASRATIYLPTRRAARALRSILVERNAGGAAILPTIRALGEFDEDAAAFDIGDALDLAPPIPAFDRILLLAPLVQLWRSRLPAHIAGLYGEPVVVPASAADAIWLARDLATLIDEVETEERDWAGLAGLIPGDLAAWWQVTLDFLEIVTARWPDALAARDRSNPAAHRSALIRAEAARLAARPPDGPVIVAGSTGSIPATAELLSVIARLPNGAVVLPGFEPAMDVATWESLHATPLPPPTLGHPQFGLSRLVDRLGIERGEIGSVGRPSRAQGLRQRLLSDALLPAENTETWPERRRVYGAEVREALAGVSLVEAVSEHDEALAIAAALRETVEAPGRTAALVTGDRALARRVSAELSRFGIRADDSGGTPLVRTAPAELLLRTVAAAFEPGDPLPIVALLKHPLVRLGLSRADARRAAETVELVALRGGTGRPDVADLPGQFDARVAALKEEAAKKGGRPPFWWPRIVERIDDRIAGARALLVRLAQALSPLVALRNAGDAGVPAFLNASVRAFEEVGRAADGGLDELYRGDAGARLAETARALVATEEGFAFGAGEWPAVLNALLAPETVKPRPGGEHRVQIWGALEARLQSVDRLVIGGMNEGVWPRRSDTDQFLSRSMKGGLELEPPERRIGQAAHDFMMAFGTPDVVLTRAARADGAPTVASRWLQRLTAFIGKEETEALGARGRRFVAWGRSLDAGEAMPRFERPNPKPAVDARPRRFSVTEIETLRRDPYAVYARRILGLRPVEPLVADPGAADRGNLFHDILHRFVASGADPTGPRAEPALLGAGREAFDNAALPPDVEAVWWPRFLSMVPEILAWERERGPEVKRLAEVRAAATDIGTTGATLSGYADRVDLRPAGHADILDYKTGSSPSKAQAHTLLAPQLALEGALLARGAFEAVGPATPAELAYVRLKANGAVNEESILEIRGSVRSAPELSADAWARLERLIDHYAVATTGYLSRALPFRAGDTDGDYDHLARVLEWSAGADDADQGEAP